jgi:L-methionine (R)-S-oxide reductase
MNETSIAGRYKRIETQLAELSLKSNNPISRMATIVALLHHKFDYYFWTGFYIINNGVLQVGPYQGSLACQELAPGKGVCWEAYSKQKTIIVPNVELFPGHIACDSRSKSEIVVPVFNKNNEVYAVLDIDSTQEDSFSEVDAHGLENIVKLMSLL